MDSRKLIAGAAVVGGVAVAIFGRKHVFLAFDSAKDALFTQLLPSTARQYAADILSVSRAKGISPAITYAIGNRESQWGAALTPPGPHGTGDFAPRNWTPTPMPPPARDGTPRGWGFGLMQLDYLHHKAWLDSNPWWQPRIIIAKALDVLKEDIALLSSKKPIYRNGVIIADGNKVYFNDAASRSRWGAPASVPDPRPLKGDLLMRAAVAAYNGGEAFVIRSVAVGKDPDFTTTGGEYSQSVVSRATTLLSKLA